MLVKLIQIELYKARKRLLFWTVWLATIAINTFTYGTIQALSGQNSNVVFKFPDAWPTVIAAATSLSATLCGCCFVFLTANEFDWKTVRQNMIDGISRLQWVSAKISIIPLLSLMYLVPQVTVGAIFAYLNSDIQNLTGIGLEPVHAKMFFGVLATFIGFLSIALLLSVSIRSAVPAIIAILLYAAFEGILSKGLDSIGFEMLSRLLPLQVFKSLLLFDTYKSLPGSYWNFHQATLLALMWLSILLIASYVVFLKRDQ